MDVLKINGKEVVLNTNLTIKELKEICDYCEIKNSQRNYRLVR
jgi:hypothetical protein